MSDPGMKLIYSEEEIHCQVERLAEEINKDYEGQELLIICVLKGGVIFLSDLVAPLDYPRENRLCPTGQLWRRNGKPRSRGV